MEDRLRIGVIFGGRSGEHEVSLVSSKHILEALDPEKYQITQIGITKQGEWLVGEGVWEKLAGNDRSGLKPGMLLPDPLRPEVYAIEAVNGHQKLEVFAEIDVVFPMLHGSFGEDGTLQGLLELTDLAYVGAGVLASSVAMDKGLFKDVMRAHQIPVTPSLLVTRRIIEQDLRGIIHQAEKLAPYPLFVKPANMGSSVGVHKCRSSPELEKGLRDAARYDRRVLIEEGIDAREIELSVLGNEDPRVSIPGEIRPTADFYSYQAKYHDESSELLIPAPVADELRKELQALAVRAYRAVDCAGMARVDFLLERGTDRVFLNEINTIPGFTPISMYPKLWEASGISYPELIDKLIQLAQQRKNEKDRTIWSYQPTR